MRKPLSHHLLDYFIPHERNGHKPRIFGATSVAVFVFGIVILEGAYIADTKFLFLRTDFLASVLPSALVGLTNADRQVQGLSGLSEDPALDAAAQAAANDMAAKGYFAHVSPDGKTPWYWLDQTGYKYSYAGQNLAVNFTDSANVESAWMNSPTHRANVLKPEYTAIGFGTANGMYEGQETTFVVEYFAAPAIASAPVAVAPAPKPVHIAEAAISATTAVQVLGTATAKVPKQANWFQKLLASPYFAMTGLLTALLALIAVSSATSLFMRGKVIHPHVVLAGTFLTLVVSGALFAGSMLGGSTKIVTADGGAAAIVALQ
jgi:hypothetical protein